MSGQTSFSFPEPSEVQAQVDGPVPVRPGHPRNHLAVSDEELRQIDNEDPWSSVYGPLWRKAWCRFQDDLRRGHPWKLSNASFQADVSRAMDEADRAVGEADPDEDVEP